MTTTTQPAASADARDAEDVLSVLRRFCSTESARLADPAILPPLACASNGIVLAWAPAPSDRMESTPPRFPAADVRALIAATNAAPELGGADVGELIRELDAVAPLEYGHTTGCDDCDGRGFLACAYHANNIGRAHGKCLKCQTEKCKPCDGTGCVAIDCRPSRVEVLDRRPWLVCYAEDAAHPHRECLLDPHRLAPVLEALRDLGAARLSIRRAPKQALNTISGRCDGPVEPRSDWPLAFVAGATLGALVMPRMA